MVSNSEHRSNAKTGVETLEQRVRAIKESADNAETWTRLIKQFTELETIDAETLLLLIDKIIVGESKLTADGRVRDMSVEYNYVGDIDRLGLEESNDEANDEEAVDDYVRQAV